MSESNRDRPDQRRAPFFDGLLAYRDAGIVPYSTPGHKLGRGAPADMVEAFGQAALGETRSVPLGEASGEISADIVTPYPPGIPVLAPGDVISSECIDYLRAARQAGVYISGPRDASLETVRVVEAPVAEH